MQQRLRVMLVDDEPTFQELVRVMLTLDPRFETVCTAASGEEALQEMPRAGPDLILLDFRLSGIDGLETAKRLKMGYPDIKIVLVTAHTEEVLSRLAKEAQVEGVIPKADFSVARLCTLLGWAL